MPSSTRVGTRLPSFDHNRLRVLAMARDLFDERLGAENDGEREPLGVFGTGFSVPFDGSKRGTGASDPRVREARALVREFADEPPERLIGGIPGGGSDAGRRQVAPRGRGLPAGSATFLTLSLWLGGVA
jgi:hypothetical protein